MKPKTRPEVKASKGVRDRRARCRLKASRRVTTAALTVVLACSQLACAPSPAEDRGVAALVGRFVADDGIYVLPDRAWRREGHHGGSFRRAASLLVMVHNDLPAGLRVTFFPDGESSGHHFAADWNGKPLWDKPRAGAHQRLIAEIPPDELSTGLHLLRIERVRELDEPQHREHARSFMRQVVVERREGDSWRQVSIVANQYVARFLKFGVTGQGATKRDGCLVLGPRQTCLSLQVSRRSDVSFSVQNQSRRPAVFSISEGGTAIAEVTVGPRSEAPLRFEAAPGNHRLTLAIDGLESGAFLWGSPYVRAVDETPRNPVVLITIDTTRRDAVSPYSGPSAEVTPTLDRFARTATTFENAYAVAPWTLPSHASIFTGLYPSRHRAGVVEDVLNLDAATLAEGFRRAGYRTVGVIGGSMASSRFGLAQGFSTYVDPVDTEAPGDVLTDAAIDLVEDDPVSPLFLFLNYFDPHELYEAPAEFQQRLGVDALAARVAGQPGWERFARGEPGSWPSIVAGEVAQTPEGIKLLEAKYLAEVAFMDHQIGRLFDALKRLGLFDPALIVVVADHGEFLGERGLFSHSYRLDRELTAVPLLIKWPNQRREVVNEHLVSHVDLFPTIAAVAGIAVPPSDGIDIGTASPDRFDERLIVYMEEHKSRFHQLPGPFKIADHLFGLQGLSHREVVFPGSIECEDRREQTWLPVPCSVGWEDRLDALPTPMYETLSLSTTYSEADLDAEEAERLRALGYLE